MVLCKKCNNLGVYNALTGCQGETEISNWHSHLQDIFDSSNLCSLCTLVIKGWRQHRVQIVQSSLVSGDLPSPPEDLYDDILVIGAYQGGLISVKLQRTETNYDGYCKVQYFVEFGCRVETRASWDAYEEILALFRVTCTDGLQGSPLCLENDGMLMQI